MNILLDTHVFLWWLQDSPRLSAAARVAMAAGATPVWVSAASIWEIAIKMATGKLKVPDALPPLHDLIPAAGFQELHVRAVHAARVRDLPFHHFDPFDRLLVAQAQVERLTLVSGDPVLARYDVTTLSASS